MLENEKKKRANWFIIDKDGNIRWMSEEGLEQKKKLKEEAKEQEKLYHAKKNKK